MFEDVQSESLESNQKNDELNQELQQYWKKILTNLGDNFLYLRNISKQQDSLEILQSLNLLEQLNGDQVDQNEPNDIQKQFEVLKSESIYINEVIGCQTDMIFQKIFKQQQLEQQNNEILIRLMKKQDENSKKLTDLQIELSIRNSNKNNLNIHSLRRSVAEKFNEKTSYSAYNSPENREIRQQSSYNNLLSNIKLTHVSGSHNNNISHKRRANKIYPFF